VTADEPAPAAATARRPWLGALLLVLAVGFVAVAVVRNWASVSADLGQLGWPDLLGSSIAAVAAMLLTGLAWRTVLAGLGSLLALRPAMTLYSAGQLGKYVPGSVWVLAIQAELGRRRGVPRSVMALSYAVAILLAIATGGLVGLLSLVADADGRVRFTALGVAVVAGLVALAVLRPRAINAVLRWASARTGRSLPTLDLPGRTVAAAVALTTAAWLLFGVHIWVLARPLGAGADLLAPATGAFALAFVAGLLLVPVPAGAGIREVVLLGLLAGAIGSSEALTVSLVSRLVLVLVDVVLAGAFGVRGAAASVRAAKRTARP
jgi:uncharacterized membrane protein YbhN (UPF0104 family)